VPRRSRTWSTRAIESNDGILFRSDDRGERWTAVNRERNLMCRGFYYADLRVDPTNADRLWMIGCQLSHSIDGGRTFRRVPGQRPRRPPRDVDRPDGFAPGSGR
jgi:photosystem II stability/assembly factor-like uncharacterized protein